MRPKKMQESATCKPLMHLQSLQIQRRTPGPPPPENHRCGTYFSLTVALNGWHNCNSRTRKAATQEGPATRRWEQNIATGHNFQTDKRHWWARDIHGGEKPKPTRNKEQKPNAPPRSNGGAPVGTIDTNETRKEPRDTQENCSCNLICNILLHVLCACQGQL